MAEPDLFAKLEKLGEWLDQGKISRAQYDALVDKLTKETNAQPPAEDTAPPAKPVGLHHLKPKPDPKKEKDKNNAIGCLILLVVGVVVYALIPETDPARKALREAEKAAQEAEDSRKGFHCLSKWDGSHPGVVEEVKQRLRDPGSFEHDETRVTPAKDGVHTLYMTYRAKNGFGGVNVETAVATYSNDNCQVLTLKTQ